MVAISFKKMMLFFIANGSDHSFSWYGRLPPSHKSRSGCSFEEIVRTPGEKKQTCLEHKKTCFRLKKGKHHHSADSAVQKQGRFYSIRKRKMRGRQKRINSSRHHKFLSGLSRKAWFPNTVLVTLTKIYAIE